MIVARLIQLGLVVMMVLGLSSCTSITREIQKLGNIPSGSYPPELAISSEYAKPAIVRLGAYKSVHDRPHQHRDMTIALAASGGGYRAANLTLGVLLGLEKVYLPTQKANLLEEIDYFSSVSGGGFGVGYYLTQLHNHYIQHGYSEVSPRFSLNNNVNEMLAKDGQAPNPLRVDLTQYLFFGQDRGLELEQRLSETLLKTSKGSLTLGDIFVPKGSSKPVLLPYWATNATIYQNAALLPFTPDVLRRYRVTEYTHAKTGHQLSGKFTESDYAYEVPVSVGVTASSSVPFAIPPTTLASASCKDQCYLQLLDGGLADNLGVYTAMNFLLQDKAKTKILILVDASRAATQPYSKLRTTPKSMPLMWRVLTASTDANRERIKPNINLVARELLCGDGTSHVIVIYLDLSHYPEAQLIDTQLMISPENQRLLLKIGQELVANNEQIKKLLKQINTGKLSLGQCRRG